MAKKRPDLLKIGWKHLRITYKSTVIDMAGADSYGIVRYVPGEISISDSHEEAVMCIDGLLHEVIHCISCHGDLNLSENQVSGIATGLGDVAAQNPDLIGFIFNSIIDRDDKKS